MKDANGNQTRVILSNVQNAYGIYTGDVTDPDLFDDLYSDALENSLAAVLCRPLSGNVSMIREYQAAADLAIAKARVADANEAIPSSDIQVDWIRTRGVTSPFGYGLAGVGWENWGSYYSGYDDMNWSM
jgi:hypothetical protein